MTFTDFRESYLTPRNLVVVGLVVAVTLYWAATGSVPLVECGPFDPPTQVALDEPESLEAPQGFSILATDTYEVTAMVMSRKRYFLDESTVISPVDFQLAWGPLTQEPCLSGIRWSQSGRWGFYRWDDPSILSAAGDLSLHTANTHIVIPPNRPDLRSDLLRLRRGRIVTLSGYLVKISGPNGFTWNSSRSRSDTGNGSCEILYVTEVR